jgi:hypothetical protein
MVYSVAMLLENRAKLSHGGNPNEDTIAHEVFDRLNVVRTNAILS